MRVFADFRKDHKQGLEPPANYSFIKKKKKKKRSLGEPMCPCRYAVRNKTGNQKKKIVRNKAIPSRAREPAALLIYVP